MRVLSKVWMLALLVAGAFACNDVEQPSIIQQTGASLLSPPSSLVLSVDERDAEFVFEVSPADFGVPKSGVIYTLQMDAPGNNFQNAATLVEGTTTVLTVTAADINRRALSRGLVPNEAGEMAFRVRATAEGMPALVGPATMIMVTAFADAIELPMLHVPGDYQGWNPANMNTVLFSENSDNVFTGFVHVLSGSGEFKFTPEPNWDADFGSDDGETLTPGGGNIKVASFGTQTVTVDLNDMTFTLGDVFVWGIIGSATPGGWDSETPMGFDADENVLSITLDLVEGDMKFRANQSWDFNYGGADGELEEDGANIPIPAAGNYTITMDWKVPGQVSYEIVKNN